MPTTPDREKIKNHLQDFTLQALFIEELGWDHGGEDMEITAADKTFSLQAIAQKRGMVVFQYRADSVGAFPDQPTRQKIERAVTKAVHEHLIVYATHDNDRQVWQWVKREPGQPNRARQHIHHQNHSGEALTQKLEQFAFTLDEEADLTISDVVERVGPAFDVEKVTKRFYDRFRIELTAFGGFIDGITAQGDRDWYASLMLNRMMFVYFIQKQGFLDDDPDYLRNRLRMVQQQSGGGRFQQFYRIFLLRLFHEGLGQPEAQRASDLAALLGKVPFLNGGLFDVHDLERDNPDISIPDEAFKRVFEFFEEYHWHLDERRHRDDNEINPDVLGYIFEKYVNQKQMGAYYTKEDITGYISRNTAIPFLFDAARKACPVAFGPEGGVWRLLRDDPDRYIYPAVGHGITWNGRQAEAPTRLDTPFDLPDDIAAGIDKVSKRGAWNEPAPDDYALPTETWREVVARRQRYAEVRAKLAAGEVREINDLITLNLDVEQFVGDVITQSEGPELLRAFWHAMRDISVLDPTCGSGAFLFAALNVLEPLYTACLEGMQGFLDDLERTERPHHPGALRDFRNVREQVNRHPSEQYFILKSIVLNNLYGVDIMEEAVEICKLRLFLKLVAQLKSYDQIEPLPDIDFNIRAGNTLVGFTSLDAVRQAMTVTPDGQHRALFDEDRAALARIEEDAGIASRAFNLFREQQTALGGEVTANDKSDLRRRLKKLGGELDRYLATEYGVDPDKSGAYEAWRASHQSFHWFVEFHGVLSKGGFNVIIGNPPWREYSAVKKEYQVRAYETESCGNLYALCGERSIELASQRGRFSFIVQLPFLSSSRMGVFRKMLCKHASHIYYIPFDDRPGKLFDGLQHCRSVIFITQVQTDGTHINCSIHGTKYLRWFSKVREHLFRQIAFTSVPDTTSRRGIFPKLGTDSQVSLVHRLGGRAMQPLSLHLRRMPTGESVFYQEAMQYWAKATYGLPFFSKNGIEGAPPHGRYLYTDESSPAHCIGAIINSSLFYVYFITYSDCFHLSNTLVHDFPLADSIIGDTRLIRLSHALLKDLHEKAIRKTIDTKMGDSITYEEFFAGESKPVIDEIDRVLAEHYSFTEEELDFIINYDIKYRMGEDSEHSNHRFALQKLKK